MKGDRNVIKVMNEVLTNELTAINQYFLHARIYENWGFERLAKHEYDESIEEMNHADKLIKRVLLLEGLPNLQDLHKLAIGETVPEGLAADLGVERRGHEVLVRGILICEEARDFVSREILREILDDTEEHIDFLETQIELVEKVGIHNYLQTQIGEAS
ncbi:bacterioferritin [Zavarzinia compransoris]|uniref:bacterioferritin n=1 Tax=Zavarzinia marina TaxID=2911065 RepID=UPI001F1D44E9|nr:bacterioferritin [Zavarzinia marina]MCF4167477.1 bacterioferritin [Zavarzinia marina]